MSIQPKPQPQSLSTEPDVIQARAADPQASVGVAASAGTGKTKILIDRVLRLLLPRPDGTPGSPPHKILCLTYTKAAAGEMRQRLTRRLSAWAVIKQEELEKELAALLGTSLSAEICEAARRLFADIADAPGGGIGMMTIHSFCQSVLGRFPLEAGIAPGFEVVEDSTDLFEKAVERTLSAAAKNSLLQQSLSRLTGEIDVERLPVLLRAFIRERGEVARIIGPWGIDGLYARLCEALDTEQGITSENILRQSCADTAFAAEDLRRAVPALLNGTAKTDIPRGEAIAGFLSATPQQRAENFADYRQCFFKVNGEFYKSYATAAVIKAMPDCEDILRAEALRLQELAERCNRALCARLTADLFTIASAVLEEYDNIKKAGALLDFDDLILRTRDLLRAHTDGGKPMTPWVLYKLDQGIDHILVDEAQDTSPEQWDIAAALADEFFSGQSARDHVRRTMFAVGDFKQSIYSFNRAEPRLFATMQENFRTQAQNAGEEWRTENLDTSFRSALAILEAVDAVFSASAAALGTATVSHKTKRGGQEGLVELWPLTPYVTARNSRTNADDFWQPPLNEQERQDGPAALAQTIAATVQSWIGKEQLPARDRPIEPGDIMILLRTRTPFFNSLVRALKERNIPVSGIDRMVLNEQIAVQDLLAAAQFALLPEDDLTLACLLKSPLLGWSEEDLMNMAAYRPEGTSLWSALRTHGRDVPWLQNLIDHAGSLRPFEFFSMILTRPCPADPQGGMRAMTARLGSDARDPLDELLSICLDFERSNIPSLQNFLHWQQHSESEVKRELEESGGRLRIMTVHAAKGLQAPIVILPDTISMPAIRLNERLLWPHKTGLEVPLFSPRKEMDCSLYARHLQAIKTAQEEEYRRLLYVAMTRAEDRLYTCGHGSSADAPEGSWYALIRAGLKALPGTAESEDGTLRLHRAQSKPPDNVAKTAQTKDQAKPLPVWLHEPAPAEKSGPELLVPSRPAIPDPPARSPLAPAAAERFRRGNIAHKMLQFLPSLPQQKRHAAAKAFLQQTAPDLESLADEILAILENPEFAKFFAPDSLAEAPITGLLPDGRLVSGQIDRLLIEEKEIWILDYKTNRPPPLTQKDVPAAYIAQMRAYRDTLAAAYPGRVIHTALLWTDGPRLMKLDLSDA